MRLPAYPPHLHSVVAMRITGAVILLLHQAAIRAGAKQNVKLPLWWSGVGPGCF
jgi:hypothetical protein